MQAATIPSTSADFETSAVNAVALPPSPAMIFPVSPAAAALRSTQNTCAPSRAKVTAVALPLPQPGPIEPAPTTIAVLPLSRGIEVSFPSCSPDEPLRHPGLRFAASRMSQELIRATDYRHSGMRLRSAVLPLSRGIDHS